MICDTCATSSCVLNYNPERKSCIHYTPKPEPELTFVNDKLYLMVGNFVIPIMTKEVFQECYEKWINN